MNASSIDQVAKLLRATARAHHEAFIETGGVHAGWAGWYAERLAPQLTALLDRPFTIDALAADLVRWDEELRASGSEERWSTVYATRLLEGH